MIWMRAQLDRAVKSGFIFNVMVAEKFRGKGYGRQVMTLIEEKARELGLQSPAAYTSSPITKWQRIYMKAWDTKFP